jgi:hypothetical protein
VEENELNYLRSQDGQKKLRAKAYSRLTEPEYVNAQAEERGLRPGKPIVLSSTFAGWRVASGERREARGEPERREVSGKMREARGEWSGRVESGDLERRVARLGGARRQRVASGEWPGRWRRRGREWRVASGECQWRVTAVVSGECDECQCRVVASGDSEL